MLLYILVVLSRVLLLCILVVLSHVLLSLLCILLVLTQSCVGVVVVYFGSTYSVMRYCCYFGST